MESAQLPCGHDEDFVSPIDDDLQCLICHLPLREPILTRCGHRFCRLCLEQHMARQEIQQQGCNCPVDREELDRNKDIFPDKATERKILSFIIKCSGNDGCEWTGELREKEDHLSSCSFKLVSCTNENCQVIIKRNELAEHVTNTCQWRIVVCDHCSEPHPKCLIQDHVDDCVKKLVECPNSCGTIIVREEITSHTNNDCPLTMMSCPYVQMGCNTEIQRKDVESHLQSTMRLHLDLACTTFKETTGKLEEQVNALQLKQVELDQERITLQKQVQELTAANATLNTKVDVQEKVVSVLENESSKFVWKVTGFGEILKKAKDGSVKNIYSSPFFTGKHGYQLSFCIQPDGDQTNKNRYLSVSLRIEKGNYDAIIPWPFHHKVTFTLIDQHIDPDERQNVECSFTSEPTARPLFSSSVICIMPVIRRFVSHKNLKTRRYIVDDTLFLQLQISPLS